MYLGVFYRPDTGCKTKDMDCIDQLDSILNKIPRNSHIWLCGDLNLPDINWTNSTFAPGGKCPSVSKKLLDTALDYNLTQTVTSPTRDGNVLDLVFTNTPSFIQNVRREK